jgi:hypothetical protein
MNHQTFAHRLAAGMTVIGFALVVVIAGWSIAGLVAFLLYVGGLLALVNRKITDVDRECDRIDQELDAGERRHLRQINRERAHPPRLMIVKEQGADVIRFLPPSPDRDTAA